AGLTAVEYSAVAWGDYDNDGDLDVLLTGWTGSAPIARVYRNDGVVANTRPAAPAGLATSVTDTAVTFGWTAAADSQTPAAGLTYNLRVGTTPGGANVLSPMSHSSGYRKVVALGNANHGLTATLQNLAPGTYYWSVQAVDTAFAGSAFASEASFVVAGAAVAPTAVTITGPTTGIVNTVYSFTAAVSPVVATTPLTYVWQTAGQPPITHTGGLSDTVDLTWSMPGTKSITVTATNPGGMTVDTHVIAATLPTNTVYLSDLAYYFHYQPIFSLGLDETVLGLPLTINGIIYAKGLGTHASSETIYDLGEIHDYTTFKTWVGHDDEATEPCGNGMIFLVSVGTGSPESISWTPVWTSTIHNFYYPAEQMPDVAVTNYRWLRLQTDDLASPSCDHADWADARLTVAEHAVRFSAASYSVNEDVGAATITVTLNAPATQTVTVGYATSDGTATAGSDYIAATGTLTFSPGITSQTFTVPLSDDSLCETGETVHLALSSPANAILGTPSMATLTIVDDDTTPLTDVTITGPATGVIDTGYTFTATISPITATTPITYVWQADGQSPITHTSGLSDTVALTWNTTGTKSITVTVTNIGGTVGDTHVSAITLPTNTVYLSDLDYYSHYQSAYDLSLDQSVLGLPLTINGVTYAKGLGTHASSETIYDLGEMHDYTTFKTWVGHDDEFGAPCGNGMIFLVSVGTGSPESISWTRVWTSTVHNFFDDAERMPDTDVTGYRWLRLETDDLADSYCDHADWAAARLDGGGQPSVYFSADSYSVNENDGLAAITVSLNAPATQTVTVDYATSDGKATAGSDYIALTGTLAFSPGLTSQTFAVPISADSLGEPDETVHLALSSPANAILGTPSMATLTIVDDDATPLTGVAISGPTTGVVNTVYPFTATASPIAATTPITYVWQTAGQSLLTHTGGLSDTVDWTWSLPGTKSITVTATNAGGTVTSTHVITVGELAPEAAFSAAPLSGVVPLTVTFTDESTGNITAWSWDFGDGGTSADQHPTHVYTRTGTYTTALLVSGPGGSDAETKVAYITVSHPAPAAAFIASPVTGTVPLNVAFTDQATGAIIAWDWTFGDASVSGARYPEHEYTIPGTYTISLTVTGPGGSDTETKSNYITAAPGEISWVFLLYLAGDNWDLYPWLQAALDRLEAASANPHLTILVLIDGPDHGDTWRYHVQPDGNCIEGVNCWDMNELNMGDPQTLSDFVIWARDNYTATHYYLAVADHGRGTTGIAWDDTPFVGDFLTVTELRTALRDATAYGATPLDVVHYDACLMAMIEDAYQVKDYARYLVASENLGWGIFAYDRYAAWVVADTSPEQLAHAIVDEYHYVLAGDELPHTISAMDLEQAGAVEDAVTTLAIALQADLAANKEYVSNSRSATQKFDSQEYYIISNDDEYLDLYDFARLIKQSVPDSSVKNAAQGVMNAVSACVVAERHQSGDYLNYIDPATDAPPYWDLNDAHGVAIYFPPQPGGYGYAAYVNNASFRFTVDGQWDEFLQAYYAVMGLPSEPPVDPGVPPVPVPPFKVYLPLIAKEN
ncbi:MAG: NPCBM/NEW2 domain-containing protein, partial [Chloroflexi bacterium]|nr:NPCBM/NEW2 domain-containing protein [Chloroflexota bacterium]